MIERLICLAALVIGYGFGLLQIAHIYSKAKNVNIREKGSGNAGTTNMFRVMGIKAGIITLVGDCAKGVAAVLVTRWLFITLLGFSIDPTALALYAGFGCILGHDFPFYFYFKGGKGMATTAALMCCIGNWQMIVLGIVVFFATVIATQYVSLGSMLTVSALCIAFVIFVFTGIYPVEASWIPDSIIIFVLLTLLLIFQHRKNIDRLLHHCEKKFYFRTSKQIAEAEAEHLETATQARVEQVQYRTEKRVDRIQNRTEKKVKKAEKESRFIKKSRKPDRKKKRIDRLERRTQTRVEHLQNKASYKEKKVQLKAELKQENSNNWAGRIADYAPKSFKQDKK